MSDLEKAARMALEAISGSGDFLFNWHDCEPNNEREMQAYQAALAANEKAFNALLQALSDSVKQPAPAQEPTVEDNSQDWAGMDGATAWHLIHRHADGWADVGKMMDEWREANTTPPAAQRQWVGLTQQDIDIAFDDTQEGGGFNEFARAIEAKLKEKNT